jgi:methionyl aminopeptidase
MILLKSRQEIEIMAEAGRLVAATLAELRRVIEPGITTGELDRIAASFIARNGGKAAFKGYQGFPASICTSINEEVVHGIPGLRQLKNGDIISIDAGVVINGYVGDAAVTVPVGEVEPEILRLLQVTEEALARGIDQAKVGNRLSDISHAIQSYVESNNFSVVRDYVGHGIGRQMHEAPQIPNFGPPGHGPRLEEGMVLAIEPMVNLGTYHVRTLDDGWTVVTQDGKPSAHFEHSVAITADGPVILTSLGSGEGRKMAVGRLRLGQLVSSRAGRDSGQRYLVVGKSGDRFVLVADGKTRRVAAPKKKNIRHLIFHSAVAEEIGNKLTAGEEVTDEEIRLALTELVEEQGFSLPT